MMKLGIISPYKREELTEDYFKKITAKGLEFVEFCVNVDEDPFEFEKRAQEIKPMLDKYNLSVGSIGRWGPDRVDANGNIIEDELKREYKLIDVAEYLGCKTYVSGCNYIESLSLMDNVTATVGYLTEIVEYAKAKGIKTAVYNCHWNSYINNDQAWKLVLGQIKDLYIKFDPSHSIYAGHNYLQEIKDWGHRFAHFHIKGALLVNGERVDDPPAGMDQIDWKSVFALLYTVGYDSTLSLEPHSSVWQGELGDKGVDFTINYIKPFIL